MTRTRKCFETYTIRNAAGQLIGRYRATNAKAAIALCLDADAVTASQFRSYTRLNINDLIAIVEKEITT